MNSTRDAFIKNQQLVEKLANPNGMRFLGGYVGDADYGFLANSLEYIDTKLHQPFARYFWYTAMPYIMAGGAKEYASFFKTNYSLSNSNAVTSGSANVLVTVKSQLEKTQTRVLPFSYILEIGLIDQMKAEEVGYDILNEFERGVMHQHNRMLDNITFFGLPGVSDSYGLFNNPNVETVVEATNKFADQTAAEFFKNIVDLMLKVIIKCDYDVEGTPNTVLLDLGLFGKLAQPMSISGTNNATATTGVSLYDYMMKNLPTRLAGFDPDNGYVRIMPNKYLANKGTNSTGRIVIYRYSEEVVRGIMGMDLTRGATVFSGEKQATLTSYVAFVGEPQFVKPSAIIYYDNKA